MSLFQIPLILSPSNEYMNYRESPYKEDLRNFIDIIYDRVNDVVGDNDINERIQRDFHAFVWQFYLGYLLRNSNFSLVRSGSEGPDFITDDGICFEAVLSTRGNGRNRTFDITDTPPQEEHHGFKIYPAVSRPHPDPQIILRITTSISAKLDQYRRWRESGIIQEDQPYVISINAFQIDGADDRQDYSYGARVCFGLGAQQFSIPVKTHTNHVLDDSQITSQTIFVPQVTNANGTEILSAIFLSDEYRDVSAIIFSAHSIARVIDRPGRDIEVIFNPKARNPIPRERFSNFRRGFIEFKNEQNEFIFRAEDLHGS